MAFGLALPATTWNAIAVLALIPLGLVAPTASVVAILAITVLVPWDVQNQLQILAIGQGGRGILFVDALLLLALVRSAWQISRRRTEFDQQMLVGSIVAASLAAATFWGLAGGADLSDAGNEGRRVIFAAGTFLLVWPLLRDPAARRILTQWLVVIGLALGTWGLAQWFFDIGYSSAGDVGIRGGLTSGQLQGGMYAYPVAVALAWSALIAGSVKGSAAKWLLAAVMGINTVCVFLTFERTLILSTALACVFVAALAGAQARRRAIRWIVAATPLLFIGAVFAEAQARTVMERMSLVGKLHTDNSFTHRMIEADVLKQEILAHPFFGSGFGATVTWGVEGKFRTDTTTFADLGYHWLAWKAGLPVAAMIVLILWRGVFRRSPGYDTEQWRAVRTGSRGALLALLVTSVLFGVFNALGVTSVIGLLVAVCYSNRTTVEVPQASDVPAGAYRGPHGNCDLVNTGMEGAR